MQRYKWTEYGMIETPSVLDGPWYKDGDVERHMAADREAFCIANKEIERLRKGLEEIAEEARYFVDSLSCKILQIALKTLKESNEADTNKQK